MLERRFHPLFSLSKDLDAMREQIERAFYAGYEPASSCTSLDLRPQRSPVTSWLFPLELTENKDGYTLRAMLPGVDAEKINIEASDKKLSLEVDMVPPELQDEEVVHLREFAYGRFSRTVEFATPIDTASVKASFKAGILTLALPKQEGVKKKSIKIDVLE